MTNLEGQTFAGYEVLSKLGEGGMGAVYKARQPMLNRLVALKVMSSHLGADPSFVARFVREASAAANLNHPNMVQVYTAGEADGVHFIAMEFVEGESLQKRLHRLGRIEPREAVAITVYVAQALQYAWNKAHLIHRDIKPDNVFLSNSGEVKVGDLGLAKSVGGETTELTQTGTAMGSPHYISPEQATGLKDVDFRTDIYSLGCTLYHMLTGKTPYSGDSSMAVMMKHVNDPPPAIFKTWPGCPMPMGMLVGKMLAKDRNARPQSYEQLVDDLLAVHEKIKNMESVRAVAVTPAAAQPKSVTPASGAKAARSFAPPAMKETVAAPSPGNRKLIYAAAGLAAVAAIAGAAWWFVGRPSPRGEEPAIATTGQAPAALPLAVDTATPRETAVAPPMASAWLPLDIATACNADIISTAERQSSDQFTFNGGRLASTSWLRKNGHPEPGLPDDGRVQIPDTPPPGFFQVRTPPAKNAMLLSGPEGCQPQPVTVELTAGERGRYSELVILHTTCHGNGTLRVLLRYETGLETTVSMPVFDWSPRGRTGPLPADLRVAATSRDTYPGGVRIAEMFAQRIPADPLRTLRSLTFSFDSLTPAKGVSERDARSHFTVGIFAISALPAAGPASPVADTTAREAAPTPTKFGTLFDGRDTLAWQRSDGGPCDWRVEAGALVAGATDLDTREKFQDFELHVEFACPQDRKQGNSGVYIQGRYELQILESFGKPATDGSCGAIFKLKAPTENASKPPDEWQTFDISFRAARFDAAGAKTANARLSVVHNDATIHRDVEIARNTGKGEEESAAPGPIRLQGYGSPVRFRNIRIKPMGTTATAMTASAATASKQLGSVFTNAVGAEMVYIPPGELLMGSTKEEREWAVMPGNMGVRGSALKRVGLEGERQPRQATLRSGFWMGRTKVTVGQWRKFADATSYRTMAETKGVAMAHERVNHSCGQVQGASWSNLGFSNPVQDNYPAVCISWEDATAFCKWLTEREREAGRLPAGCMMRLPTEAEWEYACRGGKPGTKFWWGDSKEDGEGRLNWSKPMNADDGLVTVDQFGERGRNEFGLADMAGNAWDWCLDNLDPAGPHTELYMDDSSMRVLKGGDFASMPQANRCAARDGRPADTADFRYGFRVCCGVDVSGKEAGTGTVLPLAEWKSLIPLIDPKRDGIAGGWKVEHGRLYCTKRTPWSLCELPVDYRGGNYDLRFRVTRGDGRDVAIFFLFRKGITGGTVLFDYFNINDLLVAKGVKVAGLTNVKGKPAPRNETRRERPSWLPKGQEKAVLIQVRDEGMVVTLDGEEVFRWEGNWEDVTQHENMVLSENKITRPVFGVSPHDCEAVFSAIEMREIAGKGEFTRFGANDAFVREVAALPAEQQVARVVAELKKLNPDFDGKEKHKIEGSDVSELEISALNVTDISPVRALTKLRRFVCIASTDGKKRSKLCDLTPLQGLSLTELRVPGCDVSDLSPVAGMPLSHLGIGHTRVSDLSPLKGAPLDTLMAQGVPLQDLSPLRGAPLTTIWCDEAVAATPANRGILKSISTLKTIKSGRAAQ
ncbi:MAG: SUMF1/EgtB/PvdO family nonheme iron enzyme [Verrucomicrobia bacterium]|nr:SUMF1/EgtB/PvdO family nonheme iron enzyme [Verrucomicrobiota bacterium]